MLDYYANILMPFGPLIEKKIGEVQALGLEIEVIAPDHGIIWRRDPGRILQMYLDMARGRPYRAWQSSTIRCGTARSR